MATFTLQQLKEKHPQATAKRIFSLEDIERKGEERKLTAGQQFEREKPSTFWGKARGIATSFIGGGKLAEGAGMAVAAPRVRKTMEAEQRQTEELQNKLLTRIREKKELNEDTSRLEKALKDSQGLATTLQDVHQDFEEAMPTSKEVVGSSLRLGTTLGAGMIARTAAKHLALSKAVGFGAGALRGAGAGAISGGVVGGLSGVGVGLEADKPSEEILMSGLLGIGTGAVAGGVIGGALGGLSGTLKQRAFLKENFAKELVAPKATPKVRVQSIKSGRLQDPSWFKKAELQFSDRDNKLADSVDDVVSRKATIGENIDAIRKKVDQTNTGVKDYITKHKIPFNAAQLKSKLLTGKDELNLVFASDKTAERTYNAVVETFMKQIKKKDTLGLFNARQEVDKIPAIKKLLDSAALGENVRKEIALSVRRAANEYIATQLPKDNLYRATLMKESYMLEALTNFAEKTIGIIGKNKIQLITEQYPMLNWVVGGVAAGLIGVAGVGVGSAIIGSSD